MNNCGCTAPNLYVHFPFCRRKCAYCALYSIPGSTAEQRAVHVSRIVEELKEIDLGRVRTIYFGGGTPALCDLGRFRGLFPSDAEFTAELHPLDVTSEKLDELRSIGVNRVSLGVQSFCDSTLKSMGRLHSSEEAARVFRRIRDAGFRNSGLDLIVGWPGDKGALDSVRRAIDLGAVHVSVYTLIVEPGTALSDRVKGASAVDMQSDDAMLDAICEVEETLAEAGILRYEVSNYARPGFECRHNLAVWHGEDYLGLGPGAHSRVGRKRWRVADGWKRADEVSLDAIGDASERAIFALRTAGGINLDHAAELFLPSAKDSERRKLQVEEWRGVLESWRTSLESLVQPGIVRRLGQSVYALTRRGFEVCDAVESELSVTSPGDMKMGLGG